MKRWSQEFAREFTLLHESRRSRAYHQDEVLHIINSAGIAYHQHEVLYIIKPQEKCTLARDEIHGVAVMISSPAGADDMPSLRLG